MFICKACEQDPSSHSFYLLHEVDGHGVFYSCEAESTNRDTELILNHINGVLEDYHSNADKTWEWILDGKDYQMNLQSMTLGIKMLGVFNKYSDVLHKITIIHPNMFIRTLFDMMTPFMNQKMIDLIQIKE